MRGTGIRRRTFLAGATLAALPLALPAQAATASREFRILRGGKDIGRHRLDARTTAEGFEVTIGIDIAVKFLGVTAYRYTLDNTELWRGGQIRRVTSRANDDGERHYATVVAEGDRLTVDGSAWSGPVSGEAVTTSYYSPAFVTRRPWLSTQSGRTLSVSARQAAPRRWQIAGELETTLIYDAAGEWVGCEFDAGGERAHYEIVSGSGGIAALWASA